MTQRHDDAIRMAGNAMAGNVRDSLQEQFWETIKHATNTSLFCVPHMAPTWNTRPHFIFSSPRKKQQRVAKLPLEWLPDDSVVACWRFRFAGPPWCWKILRKNQSFETWLFLFSFCPRSAWIFSKWLQSRQWKSEVIEETSNLLSFCTSDEEEHWQGSQ